MRGSAERIYDEYSTHTLSTGRICTDMHVCMYVCMHACMYVLYTNLQPSRMSRRLLLPLVYGSVKTSFASTCLHDIFCFHLSSQKRTHDPVRTPLLLAHAQGVTWSVTRFSSRVSISQTGCTEPICCLFSAYRNRTELICCLFSASFGAPPCYTILPSR